MFRIGRICSRHQEKARQNAVHFHLLKLVPDTLSQFEIYQYQKTGVFQNRLLDSGALWVANVGQPLWFQFYQVHQLVLMSYQRDRFDRQFF